MKSYKVNLKVIVKKLFLVYGNLISEDKDRELYDASCWSYDILLKTVKGCFLSNSSANSFSWVFSAFCMISEVIVKW